VQEENLRKDKYLEKRKKILEVGNIKRAATCLNRLRREGPSLYTLRGSSKRKLLRTTEDSVVRSTLAGTN